LTDLLDRGMERLHDAGLDARVFVPPFNRFDPQQYVLAERFDAVSGGPETVALFGFRRTPLWRGEAAYVPSASPQATSPHPLPRSRRRRDSRSRTPQASHARA
jgi:hypothetical protein